MSFLAIGIFETEARMLYQTLLEYFCGGEEASKAFFAFEVLLLLAKTRFQ